MLEQEFHEAWTEHIISWESAVRGEGRENSTATVNGSTAYVANTPFGAHTHQTATPFYL